MHREIGKDFLGSHSTRGSFDLVFDGSRGSKGLKKTNLTNVMVEEC